MATFKLVDLRDSSGTQFHNVIDVDGQRVTTFKLPPDEVAETVHNLVNLPIRDDDVMLCAPVRSGTHWAYEVISMLLKGNAESTPIPKVASMLEMHPRENGLKNHLYDGTIEDYFEVFMDGRLEYGDWFDYVRGMEKEIEKADYVFHVVYYEDMKEQIKVAYQNSISNYGIIRRAAKKTVVCGLDEIRRLARFLEVAGDEGLFKSIYEKCQFENMAKDKEYAGEDREKYFRHGYKMFRKGQIGDWKNYFSTAMNKRFDQVYNEKMKGSKLSIRFEAS